MMRIGVINDEKIAGRHVKRVPDQQGFAVETFQAPCRQAWRQHLTLPPSLAVPDLIVLRG